MKDRVKSVWLSAVSHRQNSSLTLSLKNLLLMLGFPPALLSHFVLNQQLLLWNAHLLHLLFAHILHITFTPTLVLPHYHIFFKFFFFNFYFFNFISSSIPSSSHLHIEALKSSSFNSYKIKNKKTYMRYWSEGERDIFIVCE